MCPDRKRRRRDPRAGPLGVPRAVRPAHAPRVWLSGADKLARSPDLGTRCVSGLPPHRRLDPSELRHAPRHRHRLRLRKLPAGVPASGTPRRRARRTTPLGARHRSAGGQAAGGRPRAPGTTRAAAGRPRHHPGECHHLLQRLPRVDGQPLARAAAGCTPRPCVPDHSAVPPVGAMHHGRLGGLRHPRRHRRDQEPLRRGRRGGPGRFELQPQPHHHRAWRPGDSR